jgi:hypothetical protein
MASQQGSNYKCGGVHCHIFAGSGGSFTLMSRCGFIEDLLKLIRLRKGILEMVCSECDEAVPK